MIRIYGITNCDTVKKARAWLAANGIEHDFHDFKKHGVSAGLLERWSEAIGWDKLVNRQGTTWRKLDATSQGQADTAAGAYDLLIAHSSMIKRPVVDWGESGVVTVGFDALRWSELSALVKSSQRA
jgi:arsenate reductase (glutaredoxin)